MNVAAKVIHPATLADLEKLPPAWRGEIIEGTLYAFPRPRAPHARVEGRVYGDLDGPFDRGRGGPGGWWILPEPSIEVAQAPEFSPDVAGWRRERLPRLPREKSIDVVPDFVCEVLSPSTRSYDHIVKRRFYASIGVGYLWYVDPLDRSLTVSQLVNDKWLEVGIYGPDEKIRAVPFADVELDLSVWWEGIEMEDQP